MKTKIKTKTKIATKLKRIVLNATFVEWNYVVASWALWILIISTMGTEMTEAKVPKKPTADTDTVCYQVERLNDNFVQINCHELFIDKRCKPVTCLPTVSNKEALCFKCDMQASK